MSTPYSLETPSLQLRQWCTADYPAFAMLNADPEVMEYFPETLDTTRSDALARHFQAAIAQDGWGHWAVELKAGSCFIGFVGLQRVSNMPFGDAVEIGWRLARPYWGKGYATEAALAAMQFAFEVLQLERLVSFTSVTNRRSQAVMQRIGMTDTGQNFLHPKLEPGHPLCEHVLYQMTLAEYAEFAQHHAHDGTSIRQTGNP